MKLSKLLLVLVGFGLFMAIPALADTSTRGCETNTLKNGEYCNWLEGKSWCAGNTTVCAVESTTACPSNPSNGAYAFSCNSNNCVLTCNSGYTNCSGTCTVTGSSANCATYNTCTSTCTACNSGYTLSGGVCIAATLKLGSGSVSGNTVIQDLASPHVYVSGNKLGVGESNPSANLHITSSTGTEGLRIISSNYSPFIIRNSANNADLFRIDQNGNITALGLLSGSNNYWNLSGSNLYASSTSWNLGIGTTNPTSKLTVLGTVNSNSTVTATGFCIGAECKTSWSGDGWSLDGNTVGRVTSIGTLDNYDMPFLANGVERMRLMNNGNLVIGAATTGVRLHVESPQGAVAFFKSTLNGGSYAGYIGNGQTFSAEEFGLYYALNDTRLATYDVTNSLLLYGGHLNTDARLVIKESTGNVGIGTTAPNKKLEVNGDIGITRGKSIIAQYSGSDRAYIKFTDTNDIQLSNYYSTVLHIGGDSNRGNVGIGTTNPTTKLYVNGGVGDVVNVGGGRIRGLNTTPVNADEAVPLSYLQGNYAPSGAAFVQGGNSFGSIANLGTNDNYPLNIETNNAIRMTVLANGNVGIGMTNPTSILDIKSPVTPILTLSSGSGTILAGDIVSSLNTYIPNEGSGIANRIVSSIQSIADVNYEGAQAPTALAFLTQPVGGVAVSEKMRITASGNVGIGTTNPGTKLEVVGTSKFNGQITNSTLAGTGNRCLYVDASGNVSAKGVDCGTSTGGDDMGNHIATQNIRLGNYWLSGDGGNEGVFVKADGNVGIGTTNPSFNLDVNGSANIKNVLRSDNWRHVLSKSFTSSATNGYLLTTAIPYDGVANRGMHSVRITGYAYGNQEPIDFVVNFYLYSGSIGRGWTNFGAYDPGTVRISYEGGFVKIWWSNIIYYPNFEVFTSTNGALTNTDSYFEGWNITDAVSPSTYVDTTYKNAQPQGLTMGGNIILNSNWLSGDGGNEGIFVNSSGNVGIGTTNPTTKLYVDAGTGDAVNVGGGRIRGLNTTPVNADEAVPLSYLQSNYGPSTADLWSGTKNGDIWNGTAGVGNVGIGTNNPAGYKLNVSGTTYLNGAVTVNGIANVNSSLDFSTGSNKAISYYGPLANGYFTQMQTTATSGYGTYGPVTSDWALYNKFSGTNTRGWIWQFATTNVAALSGQGNMQIAGNFNSQGSGTNYFAGNVGINTASPGAYKLNVAGSIYATGLDMAGNITMSNNNITGVNKLTVNTIDPLYNIKGTNYSTFASAIVGGVKEEYIGRGTLRSRTASGEYELVLDFDKFKEGSDLWVWHKVVDFSPENVEAIITPYGNYAQVYYLIKNNSIVFRSDRVVDISYRLSGKRNDWQQWPTKAIDQAEKAGFIIE
ncbi:MAG: hypothetical protein PHE20_00670 [Patescibacteria group bacterium]|nr:hypothetical protein [Patescibacteria group bacterium]